eukprot:gnl/TRDRNA2_/TRDRNA2_89172_c0_seq1.p1 gnl/TRDRNA2_/TRDRNA2_89172_c0~~gnl/TRDRNA2_/TRDRNA2_89172_c0_seq1.p1  ORF type:complete len:299 (+),score=62.85 gnl/TRDRNA2_/TRDRNA2_89172_c0_seq1:78-974(+)
MNIYIVGCSLLLLLPAASAGLHRVIEYRSPKQCDQAKRIVKGFYASVHWILSIDESSSVGEPGLKLFNTRAEDAGAHNLQVGTGDIHLNWDDNLIGLCRGHRVTIIIPPEAGHIPGKTPEGATLNFDVEILDAQPFPFEEDYEEQRGGKQKDEDVQRADAKREKKRKTASEKKETGREEKGQKGGKGGKQQREKYHGESQGSPPHGMKMDEAQPGRRRRQEEDEEEKEEQEEGQADGGFSYMDKNGDKKVSKDELIEFFKERMGPMGAAMPDGFFVKRDKDGDGFLSFEEYVERNEEL